MTKCTACRKEHHEVRKLVALTKTVNVCDECINLCVEIVHEGLAESGLVTITAAELSALRRKAIDAGLARIWMDSIRETVARADGELLRHNAK
jgi:ATP-dependent protease Clp ATPase subunit